MDYAARQQRLAEQLSSMHMGGLLVVHSPNVRYLCGFTGSAGILVVSAAGHVLFTDGRYSEQARAEVHAGTKVVIAKGPLLPVVAGWMRRQQLKRVAVEADRLTIAVAAQLREALAGAVRLRNTTGVVERFRAVKDAAEIAAIRKSAMLASGLLEEGLKAIRPGTRETDVAGELEYAARRAGAEGMSFETVVAGGARSALPHGRASGSPIPPRGFVVLDFGVILGGYCSDMTRTVHVGEPTSEERRVYEAVHEAQLAGIAAVRDGVTCAQVDLAARKTLRRAGLGRYFTHSLGHGVGLEIHESPRLARTQHETLSSGMVVTIEPGAYIPRCGGVRIEDMVVVTGDGCELLTSAARNLIVI